MTSSRRVDAIVAAAETLEDLALDQTVVIDPFEAIDRLELALCITKLDNLLGAVIPDGGGGVLVTSERSPAIQRYTAAHEIGHWVLHEAHLRTDGESEINGTPADNLEREAQLFACYFLMPQPLLDRAIEAYDLRSSPVQPEHVYWLSRDLDVSYEAAARRLNSARLIDETAMNQILAFGRMAAMQRASAGYRPKYGLADIWDASSSVDDVVSLVVEERDEVIVSLEEQSLAGWRWMTTDELTQRDNRRPRVRPRPAASLRPSGDGESLGWEQQTLAAAADLRLVPVTNEESDRRPSNVVLEAVDAAATLVEQSTQARDVQESEVQRRRRRRRVRTSSANDQQELDPLLIGGNSQHDFIVRALKPGDWGFELHYAHAYDPYAAPILTYALHLTVEPTPNTAYRARLLHSDIDRRLPGDPDDYEEFEVGVT